MSDNSDSGRKRRKRQRSASRGGSDAGDESPDDGGWGEMERPSGGMEGVTSTAHDGDAGSGAVGGAPTAKASRRGRGDGISNVEEENPSSLHFEDPYPDVFSGEYSDNDDDGEGGDAQGGEVDADGFTRPGPVSGRPGARDNDGADESSAMPDSKLVFRPGVDPVEAGEQLDYDPAAYTVLERMNVEWPCLSFDVIRDDLGYERSRFPMTLTIAAGTQAGRVQDNQIMLMRVDGIHKTVNPDASSDGDDDDDAEDDAILETRFINHPGTVNRLRAMPQAPHVLASWSDQRAVHIWDVSDYLSALDIPPTGRLDSACDPVCTFDGHADEGYAMDWCPTQAGRLLTGDCASAIHVWEYDGANWAVDAEPYAAHTDSVEDLQWSPNQEGVFASCSVDGTIKIWDTRAKNRPMHSVQASSTDVNVIAWNPHETHLLASGADDGEFKVWNLRKFTEEEEAQPFKWHAGPVTSIEWHPTDVTCLAVAGADNQITLWDVSLEVDEGVNEGADLADGGAALPSQLLFVHQGMADPKEVHWHPQVPGLVLATALDGFAIFKAINF